MSKELKPCPFCGGKPDLIEVANDFTYYSCACGADAGCITETVHDARDRWNHRPEEERLQKRIEELEKMLGSVLDECSACSDAEPSECGLEIKRVLKGEDYE